MELPGAEPFTTLSSLSTRFSQLNFTASHALTLRDIRRAHVEPAEQARISRLEMLDEVEELELVLQHYAISWGVRVPAGLLSAGWESWSVSQKQ